MSKNLIDGFIEIESTLVRFLINPDGKKWKSKVLSVENKEVWQVLKNDIPLFFKTTCRLNFISSISSGVRLINFPANTTNAEIQGNLKVKRKEYFNTQEDLIFKTRIRPDPATDTKEVVVSYLPTSTLKNCREVCADTHMVLGKITTVPDALLGAFLTSVPPKAPDTFSLLMQISNSSVTLMAIKKQEIYSFRTFLTGSIRELENLVFTSFSLEKETLKNILNGSEPSPIPTINDIIRNNRLELMTHIGGLVAEMRSKKLLDENSIFYFSTPVVKEPWLHTILSERFGLRVEELPCIHKQLNLDPEEEEILFLCLAGALHPAISNFTPPISRTAIKPVPFKTALIAALVLVLAPLPFLNVLRISTDKMLDKAKRRHQPVVTLISDLESLEKQQSFLTNVAKDIDSDINNRGIATTLSRHLLEKLPSCCRLERLELSLETKQVFITGFTVDTETALRYLDAINTSTALLNSKIIVSGLDSRRIRFDITATIKLES